MQSGVFHKIANLQLTLTDWNHNFIFSFISHGLSQLAKKLPIRKFSHFSSYQQHLLSLNNKAMLGSTPDCSLKYASILFGNLFTTHLIFC